jgi:hypothetical protein
MVTVQLSLGTIEYISIEENGLAINPFTSRLYAIGMDGRSKTSNLYIIELRN